MCQNCTTNETPLDEPSTSERIEDVSAIPNVYDCDGCGEEFPLDEPSTTPAEIGNATYCPQCNIDHILTCNDCGELHHEDDTTTIDGDHVCPSCRDDNYTTCQNCDEWYTMGGSDEVSTDDGCYCSERCANRAGWHQCSDCGDWHSEGAGRCQSCQDNYYCCDECGDDVHVDDVRAFEDDDDHNYCAGCYTSLSRRRRGDDGGIHDYSYKPEPAFAKQAWENTRYLGIELEVESPDGDVVGKAKALRAWLKLAGVSERVYFKQDGSLVDGFEIVLHPTTLATLHKAFPMRAFLGELKALGLRSMDSGRCGLHVHVSKTKIKHTDLVKGKIFFYKCALWIKKLSRRRNFSYCKFEQELPSSDVYHQPNGRYSALNITGSLKTLEIRVFRGTTDYGRFMMSVQFADAFAEYIQCVGGAFVHTTTGALLWQDFLGWAKKQGRYSLMTKWLLTKGVV